jgi:hypothetical protein
VSSHVGYCELTALARFRNTASCNAECTTEFLLMPRRSDHRQLAAVNTELRAELRRLRRELERLRMENDVLR